MRLRSIGEEGSPTAGIAVMCRPDGYQLCGCRRYGTGVTVIVVEEEYHWAIL